MQEPVRTVIPPQSGQAFRITRGDRIRLTDPKGAQVADLWAFSTDGDLDWLSTSQTRDITEKLFPAAAAMLQQAHEQGHDVGAATRGLVAEKPLGDSPARDLRYRVMSRLELPIDDTGAGSPASTTSQGAARDRQDVNRPRPPRPGTPRR